MLSLESLLFVGLIRYVPLFIYDKDWWSFNIVS